MYDLILKKPWKEVFSICKNCGESEKEFLEDFLCACKEKEYVTPLLSLVKDVDEPVLCELLNSVESPVEAMFALAWYQYADTSQYSLYPQFKISRKENSYRVDFLMSNDGCSSTCRGIMYEDLDGIKKLAIEIDGYEYHSTKEQKAHDTKRDRLLLENGFVTMRFTGSEVYNDAKSCVEQVLRYFEKEN